MLENEDIGHAGKAGGIISQPTLSARVRAFEESAYAASTGPFALATS